MKRLLSAEDRQSLSPADPLFLTAVVGIGLVVLVPLLIAAGAQLSPEMAPKLENHDMCGITTGGQEECYWDCSVVSSPETFGQAIGPDLSCLLDCFPEENLRQGSDSSCIASLVRDVIEKKTCAFTGNPGIWGTNDTCTVSPATCDFAAQPLTPGCILAEYISSGTCSETTEILLEQVECQRAIKELPGLLADTVQLLRGYSCKQKPPVLPGPPGRKTYYNDYDFNTKGRGQGQKIGARLAPVTIVNVTGDYKTELDYTHTRHRYPWICSLRIRGVNPEHLCAVTLLSVPPQPTVVVGAAHCTYLCKDTDNSGRKLPTCCCVSKGQETCRDDTVKCGIDPRAVEMDGIDAEILCGEWQTETTLQASGEEYNVVLPITEIVRHPDFDVREEGPAGGSDIAVFKVIDENISDIEKNKVYPACLPTDGRVQPSPGVHSGWSKPPPLLFLHKFARGYVKYYSDFLKQWHYNMDILKECKDPTSSQTFGLNLTFPSDSYYPPGTVCARGNGLQTCFSTGDSGSPLMIKEKNKYSIQGILSFVKGCDTFTFGNSNDEETLFQLTQLSENPATYTKLSCFLPWVARQYGLDYDGDPATDETCSKGSGGTSAPQPCRETISNLLATEYECIFPFFYEGKFYNECVLFEQENFVYPVFRCPVRNITTKLPYTDPDTGEEMMVNDFREIGLTQGFCQIPPPEGAPEGALAILDPEDENCDQRVLPFSTCKNDCPGVRSFGIIGGGSLLFLAPVLGGGGFLTSSLGLGAVVTSALGLTGIMTAFSMCVTPFCTAQSGQCCLLGGSNRGPICPPSC